MVNEPKDRSLLLHQEAVKMVEAEPELANRALATLERWALQNSWYSKPLHDRLVEIIKARDWAALLDESERGHELRKASPMACLLPNEVRMKIIRSVKESRRQIPRPTDWSGFLAPGLTASADFIADADRMPIQERDP